MTELRKCARCRSTIEIKYYSLNRKGEFNKTCDECLTKMKQYQGTSEAKQNRQTWSKDLITCEMCGCQVQRNTLSIHKRRWWCLTSKLKPKPEFEDWLMEQDYDTLLWEYKKLLSEILEQKKAENYEIL